MLLQRVFVGNMIIALILALCLQYSTCFIFPTSLPLGHFSSPRSIKLGNKPALNCLLGPTTRFGLSRLAMSDEDDTQDTPESDLNDLASYKVGQEYEGRVTKIKNNGAMVNLTSNVGVIIPKSRMSLMDFEKLKGMYMRRSEELISVEIIDVKVANQTIYGKYTDKSDPHRADLTTLAAMDPTKRRRIDHNATVVSADQNGIYVKLNEFGIAGFVSHNKIDDLILPAFIPKIFKQGKQVVVRIDHLDLENKKIVLRMPTDPTRLMKGNVVSYIDVPTERWMTGEVVKVHKLDLHIRPRTHNTPGVLPLTHMAPELIETLKKRVAEKYPDPSAPPYTPNTTWDTDLRRLFIPGDVMKVRLEHIDFEKDTIALTMLPTEEESERYTWTLTPEEEEAEWESSQREERNKPTFNQTALALKYGIKIARSDEYQMTYKERMQEKDLLDSLTPEQLASLEEEPEAEPEPPKMNRREIDGVVYEWTDEEEEAEYAAFQAAEHERLKEKFLKSEPLEKYYPEDRLEWWRGAPFVTSYVLDAMSEAERREKYPDILEMHEEIMEESDEMQAGIWRRLCIVDDMAEAKEYEDTYVGEELAAMEEEIGDMQGFHLGLPKKGFCQVFDHTENDTFPLGAHIARETIPLPLRDELDFYKKLDARVAAVKQEWRDLGIRDTRKLNLAADEKALIAEFARHEEEMRLEGIKRDIRWMPGDPEVTSETHPPSASDKPIAGPRKVWKKKGDLSPPPSAEAVSESLP